MSTAEIMNGSTTALVADFCTETQAASSRLAGTADDIGEVLAQIPDLDPTTSPKSGVKRLEGRVISQAVSMKLVFGVGIGLVIGAILPSLFSKDNRASKQVRELPAWNARESESTGSATAQTQAPMWTTSQSQAAAAERRVPPAGVAPQPPQGDEYRPAALGRQMWMPPQTSAASPTAPQATGNVTPDYAQLGPPPAPGNERYYGPVADRRDLQADNRNGPAPQIRGSTTYDYRGNPIETPAPRRDGQYPGGAPGYRYNGNDPNAVGPGRPPMPSNPNDGGAYYGNPQDNDSGVAHFQGSISAPPPGTN